MERGFYFAGRVFLGLELAHCELGKSELSCAHMLDAKVY